MTKEQRKIKGRPKWRIATLNGKPHVIKVKAAYELALEETVTNEAFCAKVYGNSTQAVISRAEYVIRGVNRSAVSEVDRKWLRHYYEQTQLEPDLCEPTERRLLELLRGQLGLNFDT